MLILCVILFMLCVFHVYFNCVHENTLQTDNYGLDLFYSICTYVNLYGPGRSKTYKHGPD